MDVEKLIEQLRSYTYWLGQDGPESHDIRPLICDEAATAISTLQDENEKRRAELEKVKEKYDAAIEYLREIEWCAGCKHFGGLDGCKKWAMGQCTEKHDLYEFIGPQKED